MAPRLSSTLAAAMIASVSMASAAGIQFEPQTIDPAIGIGYGLELTDMNGDGRKDIILADKDNVAWYENPSWKKHVIAGHLTQKDHVCLAARDIDGDGKAEVALGAQWNPRDTENSGAVFYLKPGTDRTKTWKHEELHREPTVHRMLWLRGGNDRHFLTVLPLHGRGNNAGTGEGVGINLLGYMPPSKDGGEWKTFPINDQFHKAHNYDIVPGKKGESLLVASLEGVHYLSPSRSMWKSTQLSKEGAGEVRHGKLPNGKPFIASIEPIHGNEVVVNTYSKLNHQAEHLGRTVVAENYIQGHALAAADVLGVGSDQVISGRRGTRPTDPVGIQLFAPNEDGTKWKLVTDIDAGKMACEDLKVADLNGDGRLDVVACGRRSKNVIIYWNKAK